MGLTFQFKNYVNKLRTKTNGYKKKRSELQDLRAEMGVLARTEEILRSQFEAVKLEIVSICYQGLISSTASKMIAGIAIVEGDRAID